MWSRYELSSLAEVSLYSSFFDSNFRSLCPPWVQHWCRFIFLQVTSLIIFFNLLQIYFHLARLMRAQQIAALTSPLLPDKRNAACNTPCLWFTYIRQSHLIQYNSQHILSALYLLTPKRSHYTVNLIRETNLFSTSAVFHKNISHLNLALYFHNFPATYVPLGTRGRAIISAVPTDPRAIYSTLLADCLAGQCSATRWLVAMDKTNLHGDDETREFCHNAALLWTCFASLWKFLTHWHILNWNAV